MKKICFRFTLLVIFLTNFSLLFAQEAEVKFRKKNFQDTFYVRSFYDDICFTAETFAHNSVFNILAIDEEQGIVYQSNLPVGIGLSADYKWLTIGFSRNITYVNLHDTLSERGITKYKALQFGITGKKFIARLNWQTIEGFYLLESGGTWTENPELYASYFRRGDIRIDAYFGNASYIFNHRKYSHLATLWQLEQQKKSAGSPLLTLSFNRYKISGDSSVIPTPSVETLERAMLSREAVNVNFGLGYTYTFVVKKVLFLNLGLNVAFGVQKKITEKDLSNKDIFEYAPSLSSDFSLTLGYNGEKYFGGFSVQEYTFVDDISGGVPYNYSFAKIRFFAGFRIKTKKSSH
jgi:hypothetical protein